MKLTITSNGFTGNIVATVALLFGNDLLSDALTVTAAQISLKKKKKKATHNMHMQTETSSGFMW